LSKREFILNIDKTDSIGKGAHRGCYKHPENRNLCIKLFLDDNDYSIENTREKKYYRHLEIVGFLGK
jgi:hypothetical protein